VAYDPDKILALRSAARACRAAELAYDAGRVDQKSLCEAREQVKHAVRELRDFLGCDLLERIAKQLETCAQDGHTINDCRKLAAEVRQQL
jgi:hypothetical protein